MEITPEIDDDFLIARLIEEAFKNAGFKISNSTKIGIQHFLDFDINSPKFQLWTTYPVGDNRVQIAIGYTGTTEILSGDGKDFRQEITINPNNPGLSEEIIRIANRLTETFNLKKASLEKCQPA